MKFASLATVAVLTGYCMFQPMVVEADGVRGAGSKKRTSDLVDAGNGEGQLTTQPRLLAPKQGFKGKRKKKAGPKAGAVPKDIEENRSQIELDFSDFPLDVSYDYEDVVEIQFEPFGPTFTFELTMRDNDDEPFTVYTSENPETGDTLLLTIGVTPEGDSEVGGTVQRADGRTYQIRQIGDNEFVADIVEAFMDEDEPPELLESEFDEPWALPSEDLVGGRRLEETVIDIMVLYTVEAMCAAMGLTAPCDPALNSRGIEGVIQTAIAETNFGYQESNINARLRLVHSYLTSDYSEATATSFTDVLYNLKNGAPGLEGVQQARDDYGADFVVLLTNKSGSCGVGYRPNAPSESLAYSVSKWNCATGGYTFGHEIGHNMGCNHDREAKSVPLNDDGHINYGYRDPLGQFRTVLAYNCVGGCPRRNRYSNPDITWEGGEPMGETWADNAEWIRQRLPQYASFRTPNSNFATPPPVTPPPVFETGGVSIGRSAYLEGEPIDISYGYGPTDTALENDRVAIFAVGSGEKMNAPTCGGDAHKCTEGETTHAPVKWSSTSSWPLPEGSYYAVIRRSNGDLVHQSDIFQVSADAAVTLDRSVYAYDEPIEVMTTNPNAGSDDWVAIVPSSMESQQVSGSDAEMWLYAGCGVQQACSLPDPVATTPPMIVFGPGGADEQGKQAWALAGGSYKMVLLSGNGTPLASAAFEVSPASTPAPSKAPITSAPTATPITQAPSSAPVTPVPSGEPTDSPTLAPVTSAPSKAPTTQAPSSAPVTPVPTPFPTGSPTGTVCLGEGSSCSPSQGFSCCGTLQCATNHKGKGQLKCRA